MNPNIGLEIVELGLPLAENQDATVVETLLKIIQKAALAYRDHTGKALDPSLIKTEEPV